MSMETKESSKVRENKREDKKALKKFWIIIICSAILGMILGMLSMFLKVSGLYLWNDTMEWAVKQTGVFGSVVVTTFLLILIVLIYRQARRLYRDWDGDDEDIYNRIETKLSYGLMLTNIGMIGGYFFFALGAYVTNLSEADKAGGVIEATSFLIVFAGMIYAMAAMSIAQQKIVNFEKELNPEKHGSVYDSKFTDKWLETSDEAERFIIYKSAYKAFRVMGIAFAAAWVISLIGMMAFDTGFFPVAMVLALWMIMTCTYCVKTIYYAKHPSEVMK
ncbi:MAG: DUF3169 family protein [Lachnospiraceae bacterium]